MTPTAFPRCARDWVKDDIVRVLRISLGRELRPIEWELAAQNIVAALTRREMLDHIEALARESREALVSSGDRP